MENMAKDSLGNLAQVDDAPGVQARIEYAWQTYTDLYTYGKPPRTSSAS
jgi:hypothetical protein